MDAQQLFKSGKLDEAISALNSQLRDNPADQRSRTFLFELLCFSGDYDRAEKQLSVLEHEGQPDSFIGTFVYKGALNAERTRQEMFESKAYPKQVVNGASASIRGKLNGKEFQSLSDADPRVADKLEVFAAGDYMWISYADIAAIRMEAPKRLRDLLWAPAELLTGPSLRSRDLGEVLLPVIAPLSWRHPDDQVRLGRVSEWSEDEAGEIAPFGQKLLLVDQEEIPFLEVRELEIYPLNTTPIVETEEQ